MDHDIGREALGDIQPLVVAVVAVVFRRSLAVEPTGSTS